MVHHTTFNVLLQKLGTFQNCSPQSFRSSLGLSRFPTPLTRARGVGGHCRRLPAQQSISFQKGIPKPAQTWASQLDKAKWPPVHANISGQNIPDMSPVTKPNHPSTRFKKPSKVLSFIVKTNKPPHWEYTVRAYTTKPSKKPFRIPPFSNRSLKILNPLSHLLSLFYIDNMEKPTLGR